jgi:hypothetical protein
MARSTIHERNVARRIRTAQNRNDTRPILLRIGSVLTTEKPKASNHTFLVQKLKSNDRDDAFLTDEIMFNTTFDDEPPIMTFEESISNPIALSTTPKPSSYTGIPMSLTMAGIMGSWMAVRRYTNALSRFRHTSSPFGYAMMAPLNAPHLGIPVSVVRHSSVGMFSNHVEWNKLASLLLRTMPASWTSNNKTRIPLLVFVLTGYEVWASAVLGPRSSSGKR